MLKSEICRAISERLEPKPTFKPSAVYPYRPNTISDGGYWIRDGGMFPFNPFGDEDASARLLEAMPYPEEGRQINDAFNGWYCTADSRIGGWGYSREDLKTARVLTACEWLGIEVGEISE